MDRVKRGLTAPPRLHQADKWRRRACEHFARRTGWRLAPILALFALVGLAVPLGSCGDNAIVSRFRLKPDSVITERAPDQDYEKLFPYYVDLCTVSQTARVDGGRGNPFGHAAMYIKGACKDETAAYPRLRRCQRVATDTDDPEHGAGVSVGRWYRNVNWVAVPGYQLFYEGNLKPGQRLTQAHVDATVQDALDKGVFDGVELHGRWTNKPEWTMRDFAADQSITTDFALQFARNVFCARVPVPEPVLDEVIAFLNDKNTEYATGKADYNWNLLADNCVHTVRNALAAANFWEPISVRQVKIRHLLHLAVPAHEFVNLAVLGAEGPLDDYRQIYADDALRDTLNDFKWLPTRHGALVKTLPVHEPNDIYRTDFRLFTLQSPIWMGKTQSAIRLLGSERNVDLKANLQYYLDRYNHILDSHQEEFNSLASVRGTPWRRFSRVYHDYIVQQRDDVEAKLAQLAALHATPAETPIGDEHAQ